MDKNEHQQLQLLPNHELGKRVARIQTAMRLNGSELLVISSNTNIYYLTGRIFCGYVIVPQAGEPFYAIRRPVTLSDPHAVPIRKPEELPGMIAACGCGDAQKVGVEMGAESYSTIMRLKKAFGERVELCDATATLSQARATKTEFEIELIRQSGITQTHLYQKIPRLYQAGMRDIDLQIEIERAARQEGCLGQFRIGGTDMELFMGSILVGNNADNPSPFDFAMGGAGIDPSIPVGANGSLIKQGESVMVDFNGNFTGYMTDMTRCFTLRGKLAAKAQLAHQTSIDICHKLAEMGKPGAEAKALYETALQMAKDAGLENNFMGHRQHAGFVGHGLGIEINELPVIAPRSKNVLEDGNVIALEPKFVIPGVGAVGIENTYVVNTCGAMECLTLAPEQIISFE